MRQKVLFRTGAALLAMTLVSCCFAGGTFAKYVTEGTGEDHARVAKWGVNVDVTGNGFSTTYTKNDINSSVTGNTVVSSTEEKVVAPGTAGTFGGISITGQPEVAVKIQTTADVDLSGWNVGDNGEFYCPLVFTIGDETICGLHYSAQDAGGENSFEAAIKKAIEEATSQELEAGTDLSAVGQNITYSWSWPFENKDHDPAYGGACDTADSSESTSFHRREQTDALDTLLGDKAADNLAPTINITVTTTVTQID